MRPIRAATVAAAAAVSVLLGTGVRDASGAAGSDIGGVWLFRVEGGRGVVALNFGVPASGVFTVRGLGVSLPHRAAFAVDDDAPVTLAFRSSGRIAGTIPLEDAALERDVGTLVVTGGRLGPLNRIATLHGRLTIDGDARRVVLHGLRRPSPVPDRSGGSHDGRVTGNRIASTKLFVDVAESDRHSEMGLPDAAENAGHPFYDLACSGPVRLDGEEVAGFTLTGLLVVDQRDEFCGLVETSEFGPAVVRGRFTFADPLAPGRPVLHAHVRPDLGRRFNVRALL